MFVNVPKEGIASLASPYLWSMFVLVAIVGIDSSFKLWLMFVIVGKVGTKSSFKLWLMFVNVPKEGIESLAAP